MNNAQALKILGLDTRATDTTIDITFAAKQSQLQQQREAATTDALQAKIDIALAQLDAAKMALFPTKTKLERVPAGNEQVELLVPGQLLAERYKVLEHIGSGDISVIYRAFDQHRQKDVALKKRARKPFVSVKGLSLTISSLAAVLLVGGAASSVAESDIKTSSKPAFKQEIDRQPVNNGNTITVTGAVATLAAEDSAKALSRAEPQPIAAESKVFQAETYRVKDVEFKLVNISAGSFQMGSAEKSSEKPVHQVNLKAFRMMEHEVTWAMYQPCIDAGVCPVKKHGGDGGWGKGKRPVINANWTDISQKYIPWLNKHTGNSFRLPTEAEWEYAARAGSSSKYSWGNSINCTQAQFNGGKNSNCYYIVNDRFVGTVPVKSFPANGFGLYDMHGNVAEWTQDCWTSSYSDAPSNGSAATANNCSRRVLRGGSLFNHPSDLRSAFRTFSPVAYNSDSYGFRLAQSL
jgi:formylglycine-generating enzyme required for sulfatase activity